MNDRHRLAILGASGHGKVVADIAIQTGWQELVFYDDAWPEKRHLERWEIRGTLPMLLHDLADYDGVFVAIGHNTIRDVKLEALMRHGATIVSLVHPRAIVSPMARLGAGSVVMPGAVINAFAELGRGVIVNSAATVDHDCRLGDCVHVAPGANIAGDVEVGRLSWIGAGAVVRQGVAIGANVMIGAGAAVVADIANDQVMGGVPARPLPSSPGASDIGEGKDDPPPGASNVLHLDLKSPKGRS